MVRLTSVHYEWSDSPVFIMIVRLTSVHYGVEERGAGEEEQVAEQLTDHLRVNTVLHHAVIGHLHNFNHVIHGTAGTALSHVFRSTSVLERVTVNNCRKGFIQHLQTE